MYTSTKAAATRIAIVTDHPSIRWMIRASANRFTPEIRTVAIANVAALKACAASPKRSLRYSGTEQALTISSPSGSTEADFVPGANLVCCSVRHHGAELLHQGEGVRAYAERGKTMGIPLLHPWANRLASRTYRAAGKEVTLRSHDRR